MEEKEIKAMKYDVLKKYAANVLDIDLPQRIKKKDLLALVLDAWAKPAEPVAVKDNLCTPGMKTTCASKILENFRPPYAAHVIERLNAEDAVLIGKTNMDEFAMGSSTENSAFKVTRNPWDPDRVPGGSSGGSAAAVAAGMAHLALGSDTGGSIRIPSAFNGLTGFKPTAERVPSEGTMPLSRSLDSNGPLAASVECCAIVDSILTDQPYVPVATPALDTLRLAVPKTFVFDGIDETVRAAFDRAIALLREQGAVVEEINLPEFDQLPQINRKGGFVCAEAWSVHRDTLQGKGEQYDPRVASRILRGKDIDSPTTSNCKTPARPGSARWKAVWSATTPS